MIQKTILIISIILIKASLLIAQGPGPGVGPGQRPAVNLPPIPIKGDTSHTLTRNFILSNPTPKAPDANGFIQRWLVLEPVKKNIARNNIITDSFLKSTFTADNFSNNYTLVPKNGAVNKLGDQELKWYALDSKEFNFNLFNFAYALNKPRYGLLVWLVTIINCTEEIKNIRMTAGCNSGSMWWLNGQEVMTLSGDRDLIADNVTSQRITLQKGKNIIRGAVINGPGMANFAVRFVNEKGTPIKNFTISTE